MTTQSGARIYRGRSAALADGACAQCGRVVSITPTGRRRFHGDADGRACTGSGVLVGERAAVVLGDLPDVYVRGRADGDSRLCECGWRPKRKANGEFAAHRVDPDNPVSPYCPYGAARSY